MYMGIVRTRRVEAATVEAVLVILPRPVERFVESAVARRKLLVVPARSVWFPLEAREMIELVLVPALDAAQL